jgi:hypothetical protein
MDPRIERLRMERQIRDMQRFSGGGGDGSKGPPGIAGATGPRGAAGPKGNAGPDGAPGPSGPSGVQGPPGNPGPTGDPGMDGNPGSNGLDGADGAPGAIGDKGPDGDKGPEGDKGPTGDAGPQGPAGTAGEGGGGGSLESHIILSSGNVNINSGKPTGQSAAFSAVDLLWVPVAGTDFTVTSSSITCNFDGLVKAEANVFVAIPSTLNVQRPAPQIRFILNGTETGPVGASSYIRDATGHESSSVHVHSYIQVTVGDVITIGARKGSTNNNVTESIANYSQYFIQRLS